MSAELRIPPMTMDERIEVVARVYDPQAFNPLPGHEPGKCSMCDENRDYARKKAREFLAAGVPELSGDKPTHWLAPTLLRERVDTVLEKFGADEASGYRSHDRQYALDMLRPVRDAYLGKGDGG